MKRFVAIAVAAILLGLAAPAYADDPAVHGELNVTGDTFDCGTATFRITSGTVEFWIHEGEATSGNQNVTGTFVPKNVVATDDETDARVVGAGWFGGTLNAKKKTTQFTSTLFLHFVAQGEGTVASVGVMFHVSPNLSVKAIDIGSCAP